LEELPIRFPIRGLRPLATRPDGSSADMMEHIRASMQEISLGCF
jgi:hypothetical protein